LHALTTLNDPTWIEAARSLAEKAIKSNPDNTEAIKFVFKRVLARSPKEKELQRLQQAYEKQSKHFQAQPEDAVKLVSIGASTRDTALEPQRLAAMTAVCLAIFNLDEALCRQ
jgi:hypothetical protein